jgi:hypothetical protein
MLYWFREWLEQSLVPEDRLAINIFLLLPGNLSYSLKAGLHYHSFCDHSGNFAQVNLKFLEDLQMFKRTECLMLTQYPSNISYKSSKTRIYLCKIPTVITETLIV